jgi:hypothetical protein
MNTEEKNPFANTDGSPIEGKEPEFYAWEKAAAQMKLETMSPDEKLKRVQADLDLDKRMDS